MPGNIPLFYSVRRTGENMPITLPHTVIEPTIDFTILTTSTQTFLAARPLPQGTVCGTCRSLLRCQQAQVRFPLLLQLPMGLARSMRPRQTSHLPRSNMGLQWKRVLAPGPAQHDACSSTCETLLKSGENFLFGSLKTSKTRNN